MNRSGILLGAVLGFSLSGCSGRSDEQAGNSVSAAAEEKSRSDGFSVNDEPKESSAKLVIPAAPPPSVVSAGLVPSYDVRGYCTTVSNTVGGSYMIQKGCQDQEYDALDKIRSRTIPAQVAKYCDQVGRAVGGSYMIFNGCVDQELNAASQL